MISEMYKNLVEHRVESTILKTFKSLEIFRDLEYIAIEMIQNKTQEKKQL